MLISEGFSFLGISFQVFFLDLLLSGDNAVVIALACRDLPRLQRRKAIMFGTIAAIGLRVGLTSAVALLLGIAYLKLIGAVALLAIAIKLLVNEDKHKVKQTAGQGGHESAEAMPRSFWPAVAVVVMADVVMSLDNVVALAAVARGSLFYLALGLAASIPLLMFGSLWVTKLLKRHPILIPAGGALLGWVAGDMAVSDPAVSHWVNTQHPALALAIPWLGAVYVLLWSRITRRKGGEQGPGRSV